MPVAEPVSEYLSAAPPRVRAVVRLALRLLELSSFPRRLSRLPLGRRSAHLERLEGSRVGPLRDLFLLGKTLSCLAWARDPSVQAAVGFEAGCSLAHGAGAPGDGRPPPLDPAAMEAPADVERCDVVIVGSGAGGASAARVLSEAGLSVIVVEEGGYHDATGYSSDIFRALPDLYRDGGLTVCEGTPVIPLPVGRCVGGTTVINSGTCLRAPGDVLARWRDEYGIPWAGDLDEHFEAAERALDVKPVRAGCVGRNAELCRLGAEALGAANAPLPRNAGDVVRCSSCPTGCVLDAKQAMHVSELPRAVAAGARVRAEVRARRVILERGRAAGVQCRRGDGGVYEVRARAVLLAAGALGTPELLLRQGIANSSGEVGRRLRIHPACWVGARFDEEVRGSDGVMQSWSVDEWRARGLFLEATSTPLTFGAQWLGGAGERFKQLLERWNHVAVIGVHLSERSEGRVDLSGRRLRVRYRLGAGDAATLRFGIARAAEVHFAAGAREVYPHVGRMPPLAPGEQGAVEHGRFGPRDMRLEAFHPLGTARMGADPHSSVVAPSGEAHDLPGLYVADASIFPGSPGVNPMLTIAGCARRISAGLAECLSAP